MGRFLPIALILWVMMLASIAGSIHHRHATPTVAPKAAVLEPGEHIPDWGLTAIGAQAAWTTTIGTGTTICDIDSGISPLNQDVAGKIVAEADFIDDTPDYADYIGHGDHTAGIALGDGQIKGVAPGAKLLVAKVFGQKGEGSTNGVVKAIYWCADQHASVINMSLGGVAYPFDGEREAVKYACAHNVAIAVAAGNDGRGGIHLHPGSISSPCLIAATAMNPHFHLTTWTNWKVNRRGVVAPGKNILSDWDDGTTRYESGTSMASPFVAGSLALLRSVGLTARQAVSDLLATAAVPAKANPLMWGYGRINVQAALQFALSKTRPH